MVFPLNFSCMSMKRLCASSLFHPHFALCLLLILVLSSLFVYSASAAKVVSRLEEEAYVEDRNPPRDGSRLRKVVGNMGVLDPCYRAKATSRRLLEGKFHSI